MVIMIFKQLRRFFKYLLIIVGIWALYFLIYGNFHQIDASIYRSAQLFRFNMPYYLEHYRIRSVLNLRGPSSHQWYQDEIRICQEHNVTHINYGFGDREPLSLKKMERMLAIIKQAPKPLLIHCKAGADRTSLAAALYLYDKTKDHDPDKGFSLLYGHFPWLGSKTVAMDKSFENYKAHHP